ncbi:hypothetical protein J7J18_06450 [bacterium]|nr:hypothetical protein [bacterium]
MAWLTLKPVQHFLTINTIKRIDTSDWPEAVIVFTDDTAVRLIPCVDVKNSLTFTGGDVSVSPYILATPLKLENGEFKVVQLEIH